MNEILIEVFVPSVEQTYDIFVMRECMVYELLELIGQAVKKLSENRFRFSKESVLCFRLNGEIIDVDLTVDEAGIKNGTQLLLM